MDDVKLQIVLEQLTKQDFDCLRAGFQSFADVIKLRFLNLNFPSKSIQDEIFLNEKRSNLCKECANFDTYGSLPNSLKDNFKHLFLENEYYRKQFFLCS